MPKGALSEAVTRRLINNTMTPKENWQWFKKHYTENERSRNTNPTKNRGWTHMLRRGKQFLFHMWHQL